MENWCCVSLTSFVHVFPPRGENDKTRGKISDLRKKGDFFKCYLHNFKSYRYSRLHLNFHQKSLSFFVKSFWANMYSIVNCFHLDILKWGMWHFKATFATCSSRSELIVKTKIHNFQKIFHILFWRENSYSFVLVSLAIENFLINEGAN